MRNFINDWGLVILLGFLVLSMAFRAGWELGRERPKQSHFISLPDPEEFKHVAPGDHLTIRIEEDTTKVEFIKSGGMMVIP